VRPLGEDRIEVLLMCIPREVVRVYLESLADAFVRPRGIVLASTAIADYLAFCQGGGSRGPNGLMIGDGRPVELALVSDGRLVASQLLPAQNAASPAELSRSLARQLADGAVAAEDTQLYRWQLANGGPGAAGDRRRRPVKLASGRLAPRRSSSRGAPAVLPAVGAALDAVREGSVPVNCCRPRGACGRGHPAHHHRARGDGGRPPPRLGGARSSRSSSSAASSATSLPPARRRSRRRRTWIADYWHQPRCWPRAGAACALGAEGAERPDPAGRPAHPVNAAGAHHLEGLARSASELVPALDKSKLFRNVSFSSPTTKVGDKERFTLTLEVEK
jgi:hypothetical protein